MNSQLKTVTLTCTGCGAALSVTPDMDRFACGYCGTQQIVQREGGTIALKLVTDAISQVQSGTDRTAAELALKRIPAELAALNREEEQMKMGRQLGVIRPSTVLVFLFLGGVSLVMGVTQKKSLDDFSIILRLGGVLLLICGGIIGIVCIARAIASKGRPDPYEQRLAQIYFRRKVLMEQMSRHSRTVDT